MRPLPFCKYHGTGNDFVMVDGRKLSAGMVPSEEQIRGICHRHFGIGADGFILLAEEKGFDFRMDYYNADGKPGSMCGNGGRCAVAFARELGLIESSCTFIAYDGPHRASISGSDPWVELQMGDVAEVVRHHSHTFLDTGSPHHVEFVDDLSAVEVVARGRKIRWGAPYGQTGTNVNFVEISPEGLRMATYERGVEDETLSCGTGVTAAALAYALDFPEKQQFAVRVFTRGGELEVRFQRKAAGFSEIYLCGPAKKVFEGNYLL